MQCDEPVGGNVLMNLDTSHGPADVEIDRNRIAQSEVEPRIIG